MTEHDQMMADMGMPMDMPWSATDVVFTFAMWSVMMVGMMTPSAAPVVMLFAGAQRGVRRMTPVMAFSRAFFVTICRGRRSFWRRSMTSRPAPIQASFFVGSFAGMSDIPIGERPSIVPAIAIVLAVNCPPQAPAPGQALSSMDLSWPSLILPAAQAPMAS